MPRGAFNTSCDIYKGPGSLSPGQFVGTFPCRLVKQVPIEDTGPGSVDIPYWITINGYEPVGAWTVNGFGMDARRSDQIAIPSGTGKRFWVVYTDQVIYHALTPYWRAYLSQLPLPPPYIPEMAGTVIMTSGGAQLSGKVKLVSASYAGQIECITPAISRGGVLLQSRPQTKGRLIFETNLYLPANVKVSTPKPISNGRIYVSGSKISRGGLKCNTPKNFGGLVKVDPGRPVNGRAKVRGSAERPNRIILSPRAIASGRVLLRGGSVTSPGIRQSTMNSVNTSPAVATWPSPTLAGSGLIMALVSSTVSRGPGACTYSGLGAGWTFLSSYATFSGTVNTTATFYYITNSAARSGNENATPSWAAGSPFPNRHTMYLLELQYLAQAAVFDVQSQLNGNLPTSPTTGLTGATVQTNEIGLYLWGVNNATGTETFSSPLNGYSILTQESTVPQGSGLAWKLLPTLGQTSSGVTCSASTGLWVSLLTTWK